MPGSHAQPCFGSCLRLCWFDSIRKSLKRQIMSWHCHDIICLYKLSVSWHNQSSQIKFYCLALWGLYFHALLFYWQVSLEIEKVVNRWKLNIRFSNVSCVGCIYGSCMSHNYPWSDLLPEASIGLQVVACVCVVCICRVCINHEVVCAITCLLFKLG